MSESTGTQEHDREYETKFMQTAGPVTRPSKTSFFDVNGMPETPVVPPGTEMPPEGAMINIQALVNPDEHGAASLLGTIASAFTISQALSTLEFFTSGSMAQVITLLAIVGILMLRPQGLFALKVRK